MLNYEYGDPVLIKITELDKNLADDIRYDSSDDWALYESPIYDGDMITGQTLQIIHSMDNNRAGLVFCGNGSSGHTMWTDAYNPADALRRFLEDDLIN